MARGSTARAKTARHRGAQKTLRELVGALGIDLNAAAADSRGDIAPFVDLLVQIRSDLRAARQYALADKIRDDLAELGVTLEDGGGATEWRLR